jgi:hypothetical protein
MLAQPTAGQYIYFYPFVEIYDRSEKCQYPVSGATGVYSEQCGKVLASEASLAAY